MCSQNRIKMNMKIFLVLIFCTTFIAFLTIGAYTVQAKASVRGVSDDLIKIGGIAPLTGPASFDGQEARRVVQIWVDKVNSVGGIHGRKVEVIWMDSMLKPNVAIAAARKLISQDKVFCLIGPAMPPRMNPVSTICMQEKVPAFMTMGLDDATADPFRKYIFHANATSSLEAFVTMDFIRRYFNPKRGALLDLATGDYTEAIYRAFKAELEKHGGELVARDTTSYTTTDFKPALLRIKKANPDLLLLFALFSGQAIRQAREVGITQQICGTSWVNILNVAPSAGAAIKNVMYPTVVADSIDYPRSEKFKEYLATYEKKYPGQPKDKGTVSFIPYSVAAVIGEALKRCGRDFTMDDFINALESIREFDCGVVTPISIYPGDHRFHDSECVFKYSEDGKRKYMETVSRKRTPIKK